MEKNNDHLFRIMLIGNSEVGKACILLKFTDNSFSDNYIPTIEMVWTIKTIDLNGLKIQFLISDSAGQEWFRPVVEQYYKAWQGFIIVFDVNQAESFHSLSNWINSLKNYADELKSVFIVGNKSDLTASRQVSYDEAKAFAEGNGMSYIEVSALTGHNVEALFRLIATELVSKLA